MLSRFVALSVSLTPKASPLQCRFTAPNQEINCYAAQAKYLEDNSDAKDALYPAWLHYTDISRAQGRAWPSEMCNICAETTRSGTQLLSHVAERRTRVVRQRR